jgi:hypothetical protein
VRGLFLSLIPRLAKNPPDRRHANRKASFGEFGLIFAKRGVGPRLAHRQQKLRLSFHRRRAVIAAHRLGANVSGIPRPRHPADRLDTPTRKCTAAWRRDMPPSIAATTRSRKSTESDSAIVPASLAGINAESDSTTLGNPVRFYALGKRASCELSGGCPFDLSRER